jgi:hypothetical protein
MWKGLDNAHDVHHVWHWKLSGICDMRLLLNLLWVFFGGWLSGLLWILGGLLLAITIVGLPYTGAAFRIAGFAFWPFGL